MMRARGFSLVELLVSIVIGSLALLAMVQTMSMQDTNRRMVVSGNDTAQATAYSLYLFDSIARSASANVQQSGLAQAVTTLDVGTPTAYGCPLTGTLPSGAVLGALALPAPFDAMPRAGTMFMAPVLIQEVAAAGSHRIAMLRGAASLLGTAIYVERESAPGVLEAATSFGLRDNEWVFGADFSGNFGQVCPLARIESTTPGAAGASAEIRLAGGASFGWVPGTMNGTLSSLGMAPQFELYGVDEAARRLLGLDLFGNNLVTPRQIADNVVVLRALYGIDDGAGAGAPDPDGIVDRWVTPTADFAYDALTDGSAASADRLRRIAAVRIGLVLRQPTRAGQEVGTPAAVLFDGLAGATAETYTVGDAGHRARAIEFTLSLRSARLAGATLQVLNRFR